MTVKIEGMSDLSRAFKTFMLDVDKAVDDAVISTAAAVNKGAIDSIRKQTQGGKVVKRGNKTHTVSKKGEAPNADTGNLISRIKTKHKKGSQEAYVYTDLDYGFFLETVKDRPWLEPAKEAEKDTFQKSVTVALNKQIEDAGK